MFIKGMDVSSLREVEKCGGVFFDQGVKEDLFSILKRYGTNSIRLRVWNDPRSEEGYTYGAGGNDLATFLELAGRANRNGMGVLLDLHYSDFWTDPGKQFIPKEWKGKTVKQLEEAVYQYTVEIMKQIKTRGIRLDMVQVGNEVTNGLLWPYGKVPEYDNIARFLNAGIRGVRAIDTEIPVMIHLDCGCDQETCRVWFDEFTKRCEDFQVIGLSYYPFWQGTLEGLAENMKFLAERYGRDVVVAEVSMGHTLTDYADYEKLSDDERKGMATKPHLAEKVPFAMTPEGQKAFMQVFLEKIQSVPDGKGKGFYYWEPAWLPVSGSGWATWEGLAYIEDRGPCGNEWANQALFDYDGNALPALETIRDFQA
ncbi:MAG: glycosyl hydrolase [Clostridiales bacterium]|nr:glycosyl hydrolase [Clostridiales bacterium]